MTTQESTNRRSRRRSFLYWPQFDGLLDELKQKPVDFINYFSDKSKIIDLGLCR